jgi:Integrase core domain
VLTHHRRRVVHFNVTEHPTAVWTAQQIVAAFPDDSAPSYLLRDRDQVYGEQFRHRVKGMRIEEVLTAPHSPWQNPFAERLIGSIRRECLNHVLVLSERHLRRILTHYFAYYHQARTHLALDKDAPNLRRVELPAEGKIVQLPEVGGLTPPLLPPGRVVPQRAARHHNHEPAPSRRWSFTPFRTLPYPGRRFYDLRTSRALFHQPLPCWSPSAESQDVRQPSRTRFGRRTAGEK